MVRIKLLILVVLCVITCTVTATELVVSVDGKPIKIIFITPKVIRVIKYQDTIKPDKEELVMIKTPEKVPVKKTERKDYIQFQSPELKVSIHKKSGVLSFFDGTTLLLRERKEDIVLKEGVKQGFLLSNDEAIYGLGQHQDGKMNQRGQHLYLKQRNTEIAIPFFQSTAGYGVYWNNYSATTFSDNEDGTFFSSEKGSNIDYVFIKGAEADDIIASFRALTGTAAMFPKWAFGYWQSKERYKSQFELLDVVKQYRKLKVPLDGIIQDWQYWGVDKKMWNGVTFNNPLFPAPDKMIDSIHQLNAKLMISVWPSFGSKTQIYKELESKNKLYDFLTYPPDPEIKVYDAFSKDARDVYWKHMNKNLFAKGVDGWWLDATEPVMKQRNVSDGIVHHENEVSDMLHNPKNQQTALGDFEIYANAYPLQSVAGIYDGQRNANKNKRVFIMTRSAFAGQQRYASMLWSGDIRASWQVLKNQIAGGVNLSMTGIPYWNTDIGGFFITPNYPKGVTDTAYQKLYVRWLQFAAFTPMFRSHGTQTPREIYQFGEKGYWAYDAIEKFINLRYQLLPYIYSNAWEVTAAASTMMRGLAMDFKQDKKTWDINDQYLFGKSLLVAPIVDSLSNTRQIYLPKGTTWTDFWTGEQHQGGNTVVKKAPTDIIPLYVKAGSIIPFAQKQQYVGEKADETLELRIYTGADGEFSLYEDEGDNYNYEKGISSLIAFSWNDKNKSLTISKTKGEFPGMLKKRRFHIVLVNQSKGTGAQMSASFKAVEYSGKQQQIRF